MTTFKTIMRKFLSIITLISLALGMLPINAQESPQPITLMDANGTEVTIESLERIVSASGDVTEIITALGFYENLVGVDATSTYPPEAITEKIDVGFARSLALEPVAAADPTVVFCTQTCSPVEVFEGLRNLGIPVVIIPDSERGGLELPFQKIEMVAAALGVPERGAELAERLQREIEWSQTALANVENQPSVLHVYIRGRSLQLAVGADTPADSMIAHAGAINAAADIGVTGYEPLSPEIILSAFPEWLLLTSGNVESSGGLDAILQSQGINATPAAQSGQIIIMDTLLLLGLSLRTGQALLDIAHQLHPDMTWEVNLAYPYTVTDAGGVEVTVAESLPLYATSEELLNISRRLGFHSEPLESPQAGMVILATVSDDVAAWREAGAVVLVAESVTISEIAELLNVPGRGEALQSAP